MRSLISVTLLGTSSVLAQAPAGVDAQLVREQLAYCQGAAPAAEKASCLDGVAKDALRLLGVAPPPSSSPVAIPVAAAIPTQETANPSTQALKGWMLVYVSQPGGYGVSGPYRSKADCSSVGGAMEFWAFTERGRTPDVKTECKEVGK